MKKLQVLGTGCGKCHQLEANTREAADALGIDYELEKVTDMMRFADFGVMVTPALVVDGEVKVSGKAPAPSEIEAMLRDD